MDFFPSLLWPARWGTRRPPQQVDTVIKGHDLLMRSPVSHQVSWQIGPPLGQALAGCPSGLGR